MSRNPLSPGSLRSVFISGLVLALMLSIDCANAEQQVALQQTQTRVNRVADGDASTKPILVLFPKRLATLAGETFPAFANAEKELDLAFQYLKGTQEHHSLEPVGRKAAFNFGHSHSIRNQRPLAVLVRRKGVARKAEVAHPDVANLALSGRLEELRLDRTR